MSLIATLTAANALLRDASDATYVEASHFNADPHAVVDDFPLAATDTLLSAAGTEAIGYVVFRVRALRELSVGASLLSDAITWTLAGITEISEITLGDAAAEFMSEPQYQKPGGGAWSWADLTNLTAIGISSLITLLPLANGAIRLAELAVDVYAPEGIEGDLLSGYAAGDLPVGSVEGDLGAGSSANDLPAGSSTGDLLIDAPAVDMEAT